MYRPVLSLVLLIHSMIHLIGFAKAFGYRNIPVLTSISRPMGALWFIAALLFLTAAIFLFVKNDAWWRVALVAIFISQLAILASWQDAKTGTLINLLVLALLLLFK